ncbi:interleukin-12 subunit beta-like [Pipra filicauda]|uniref:Interleukin-12 subunit beta n=1 Tax=Pipra filicauda TaxID=649802 RepID=A0A6J2HFQ1_9PASS|nr:interleukin-12 subunit beta-like [Pipra filicauda]
MAPTQPLSTSENCDAAVVAPWGTPVESSPMLGLVGLVLCLVPVDTLTAFPPKFQVGQLNEDVVVQCDTLEPHVSWTLNGEQEPMAELEAEGRNLTILGLDLPATGNYSCWAGPVLLDTTYVVVSGAREEEINVSCQAESYHGSFHCSWPGPPSVVFRARLTRSDGSLGPWVPVAGGHGRFNATLVDPSFCPFGEELRPLWLHLEGLSDTSYLSLSKHFFLRDIVRPDPPQELTLRWQGEQLHLAWAPPASWQRPTSYFVLLYHLQYELPNGTQVERFVEGMEETQVQVGARRVRISCRDPHTPLAWSPWSPWQDLDTPR